MVYTGSIDLIHFAIRPTSELEWVNHPPTASFFPWLSESVCPSGQHCLSTNLLRGGEGLHLGGAGHAAHGSGPGHAGGGEGLSLQRLRNSMCKHAR